MPTPRPWGGIDPNSQHQLWSRWTFRIWGRPIPLHEIKDNAARWLRKGFGSVGRAKIEEKIENGRAVIVVIAEIEGRPAHDPDYQASVGHGFAKFVQAGWGATAVFRMDVTILAGDEQQGAPKKQLIVLPRLDLGGIG